MILTSVFRALQVSTIIFLFIGGEGGGDLCLQCFPFCCFFISFGVTLRGDCRRDHSRPVAVHDGIKKSNTLTQLCMRAGHHLTVDTAIVILSLLLQ